jgi:alkylation response protein AidB-like acyl-CoA dehydrogenase
MENFYRDNPDLRFHMQHADWATLAPLLELDFRRSTDDPEAPGSVEEYVETNEMILDLVGDVVAAELAPHAAEVDREGCTLTDGVARYAPRTQAQLAKFSELGLMGLVIGRKYGGMGRSQLLYNAAVEIVSRGDPSFMTIFAMGSCGELLERFASEEVKDRCLPDIARGATAAMAFTEPDFGSALGSVRTRAEAVPGEPGVFTIHGAKQFITNGGGRYQLVLARSETNVRDARGLSMFLVEMGPGVTVTKIEEKLGIHGSMTCAVNYDGARGILVGERGKGLTRIGFFLMHTVRIEVAAQAIGIAHAAQRAARQYAATRVQFGKTVDQFPAVREHLVESEREIQVSRCLVYETARWVDIRDGLTRRIETGLAGDRRTADKELDEVEQRCEMLTPLAKYYAAEMVNRVTSRAIQIHGGYGYVAEYPVERYYRDARITAIYEGTSEIQISGVIGLLLRYGERLILSPAVENAPSPPGFAWAKALLYEGLGLYRGAAGFLRDARDRDYAQLTARSLCDMFIDLLVGCLFLGQASKAAWKAPIARAHLAGMGPRMRLLHQRILGGDRTAITDFDAILGAAAE